MLEKYGRCSKCGVVALALVLVLAGCGESTQTVVDLVPLQMQMVKEYGGSVVVVELQDGDTLRFLIAEEASGIAASDLGPERARQIAEFACNHYGSMDSIDTVEIAFEIRRDGTLVDATGQVAYAFARNDLACGGR